MERIKRNCFKKGWTNGAKTMAYICLQKDAYRIYFITENGSHFVRLFKTLAGAKKFLTRQSYIEVNA